MKMRNSIWAMSKGVPVDEGDVSSEVWVEENDPLVLTRTLVTGWGWGASCDTQD